MFLWIKEIIEKGGVYMDKNYKQKVKDFFRKEGFYDAKNIWNEWWKYL